VLDGRWSLMDLRVTDVTAEKDHPEPDPLFRFIDLAKNEDGRWTPRLRLPENVPAQKTAERAAGALYWSGASAGWADLRGSVDAGKGIGLLPQRSGLVVLDCDIRQRDGDGFVVVGDGRAKWAGGAVQRGRDDLERVVLGLGRELPATWTVRTKSGGVHLYFRCAPGLMRSSGHREGWCIDVKASSNTWVVAPPTPGYTVIDSSDVALMPDWLATWLNRDLADVMEPLGGKVRAERSREVRAHTDRVRYGGGFTERDKARRLIELSELWIDDVLLRLAESNMYGGWNNELYAAVMSLKDIGMAEHEIWQRVLEAAAPWDEREQRAAVRTISSALGRVGGGV
jgi:hypothetical protein